MVIVPSSHKEWKDKFFFMSVKGWERSPLDEDVGPNVPLLWGVSESKLSPYFSPSPSYF